MRECLAQVEAALEAWVPAEAPGGLGEAMRYGVVDVVVMLGFSLNHAANGNHGVHVGLLGIYL